MVADHFKTAQIKTQNKASCFLLFVTKIPTIPVTFLKEVYLNDFCNLILLKMKTKLISDHMYQTSNKILINNRKYLAQMSLYLDWDSLHLVKECMHLQKLAL